MLPLSAAGWDPVASLLVLLLLIAGAVAAWFVVRHRR